MDKDGNLKRGEKVHIEFDVIVPIDCKEDELKEWLEMEFNYSSAMKKNSFTNYNNDPLVVDMSIDCDYRFKLNEDDLKELEEHER